MNGVATCAGTPRDAPLTCDVEQWLKHWQSTPTSPTTTEDYLYDEAGQHIQKQSVSGSTTTLTTYIGGGIEEVQSVNGRLHLSSLVCSMLLHVAHPGFSS